jgi:ubiquinone/menaquinone biosynthesis C-methylase UbiE
MNPIAGRSEIERNPFADPGIAGGYESWYGTAGRQADVQEKALLQGLLAGFEEARTVLEVGCGTGHFTRWFGSLGLQPAGLDLSRPMLDEATRLNGLAYLQGNGMMLPFAAGSFDLVALITTLEFLPDPRQALAEALRVARQGLILGVLNAQSRLGREYRRKGGSIWGAARLFTPAELKQLILEVARGEAQAVWRTTLWPFWPGALPLPWGGFMGMAVRIGRDRGRYDDRYFSSGQSLSTGAGGPVAGH